MGVRFRTVSDSLSAAQSAFSVSASEPFTYASEAERSCGITDPRV